MDQPAKVSSESSLAGTMDRYADKGFRGTFSARAEAQVLCGSCRTEEPAEQVPLKALHRFEGESDPADEVALAAIECPNCGEWGTLVLSYGTTASPDDLAVLQALMDDRHHSPIRPGM